MTRWIAFCLSLLLLPLAAEAYGIGTPIASDSRIKTFVYNENDVYRLLTHYGYQLNIEFGNKEEIETISVGDRTGWQIIPAGSRLFVRGMEDKAHTNMTVVTNRHAYQFDLYASPPGEQGWDELVYVVRFYYPEDQNMGQGGGMPSGGFSQNFSPNFSNPSGGYSGGYTGGFSAPSPSYGGGMTSNFYSAPSPSYAPPAYNGPRYGGSPYGYRASPVSYSEDAGSGFAMGNAADGSSFGAAMATPATIASTAKIASQPAGIPAGANYDYSYTGEQSILPSQMYDDGQQTYLVFSQNQKTPPQLFVVDNTGAESPIGTQISGNSMIVSGTHAKMVLRAGNHRAEIYNETLVQ